MADDRYIAGLRAAESACWERWHRHRANRKKWAGDPNAEIQCLLEALEAAECAVEIQSLIAAPPEVPA